MKAIPPPGGGARARPRRGIPSALPLFLLALTATTGPGGGLTSLLPTAFAQVDVEDADDADGADFALDDSSWELNAIDILLRLYDTTRGPEWTEHAGWFDPAVPNVCDWHGIECYDNDEAEGERRGQVRKIDLSENRLRGVMPEEVYFLKHLESLSVRDNPDLDVTFVGIDRAIELTELVLSNTGLTSLRGIARSKSLQSLHVTDCDLDSEIPDDLFMLADLRGLFANYAGFVGTIPTKIGYLRQLTELYLYENELTGPVPTELGRLTNLKVLALAQNGFSGTIPPEINNLERLEILAIQREFGKEKGDGLSGPLPAFDNLRELTEMYFENQNLVGEIPPNFLQSAPKGEMVKVDLMNNDLNGTVPPSLQDFDRLTVFLVGNKITSIPPEFCSKDGWMDGLLGDVRTGGGSSPTAPSGCDAILCPPGTYNDYGRALPSEPCKACADLVGVPYLGVWECENPDASREQADILGDFYIDTDGDNWINRTGWMTDTDECTWAGIECDAAGQVSEINMFDNGLRGNPASELFLLPKLNKLDLMANLIDFKFDGIDKATSLEYLYLSNTGLSSLEDFDQIGGLPLKELRLSQNNLEGEIPEVIFQLGATLHYLSLSHNKFDGPLPADVGLLTNLVEFHVYGNDFTGQIPTQVGDIGPQLKMLVLAENDFEGILPPEIGRLTGLETLSVHQTTKKGDGVGGTLPAFEDLSNLQVLHLHSNDLKGSLPPALLSRHSRLDQEIDINLSDNGFTGGIPNEWMRFTKLVLNLAGNSISSIGTSLCEMGQWNGGNVGTFGCDAILCPAGKYNAFGRQVPTAACDACSNSNFAQFMGSTDCEEVPEDGTERDILEKFYYSTSGDEWEYNDGWTTKANVCEDWFGISCNDSGEVTKIVLSNNGLSGTPTTDVFKLPQLRELDLQSNDINFDFDGIGDARYLHTMYLSDTSLSSLNGIGQARALKLFHATSCDLQELPEEMFRVTTFERLFLNYNEIGGRLSTRIGQLTELTELYLMHNRLEGQIPAAIGSLSKLQVLALTENNFDGTLPPELNDLRSIQVLAIQREGGVDTQGNAGGDDVGTNQGPSDKEGGGIRGPLLSLNGLPRLSELYLGSNDLTGTIPYDFLAGVENKGAELIVDLVSNQLEGTVPAALAQFDNLTIYMAGNRFEAIAPGLCSKDGWMEGDVGDWGCDGLLCEPGTYSVYGRQSDSDTPCKKCDGSDTPYYGSFKCLSDAAEDSLEEREILSAMYDALDGPGWTLSTNWMGDMSICDWHGVQCLSDTVPSVQGIRLPSNGMVGTIPPQVFKLPNLQEINVGGNEVILDFSGIEVAKRLSYLNLDGTGLKSLAGIEKATNMKLLHVMGNDFNGTFPNEIYALTTLEVLYLSNNDIGPTLPSQLNQLPQLVYFQCFQCGLGGPVPTWFSTLPELEYLRLDQNSYTGTLPPDLMAIPKLEHLDLSDQISRGGPGLTGPILSFSGLPKLSELYMNKNNLAGPIPADFLGGADPLKDIKVDLRRNKIDGAVPASLANLPKISLYLSDNHINATIPPDVCTLPFAKSFGCDGILCPPGTFNPLGRQTDATGPCVNCTVEGLARYYGSTQCGEDAQRDVLEKFYYALKGGEWDNSDGWLLEPSVCDWHGIECDAGRIYVTGIDLEENGLEGAVPPDIFDLPKLATIMLKKNEGITFPFDGLERATQLEMLSLSEIGLTSVAGISKAKNLKRLHLTNNNLGTIPDEIYSLTGLTDLYMNYNGINDTISTKIGQLTAMKNLFLFHNRIRGSIPHEIGNLRDLIVLALGENFMTGELPMEMSQLTNLEIVALQREAGETAPGIGGPLEPKTPEEIGQGFRGLLPPFNTMPKLRELYLGSNSFSGEIPNEFLAAADRSAVVKVDLSMNDLVGPIPDFLKDFDAMRLYAAGNRFRELPQTLCQKGNWMGGEVGTAGCNAILCPPNTYNDYGRQANAETPCEPCPFTYTAEFYGSILCIPTHKGELTDREILRLFYESTGGGSWTDGTNWMDDGVSICQWHGVHCASEDGTGGDSVVKLHLPSNGLSGTVPPVLFRLPNLEILNLRDNAIDVEFEEIGSATSLAELYLDSTKVTSVDGIGRARNLNALHLQQNNFNGRPIPEEIFELRSLKSLFLSDSNFGGTLSRDIKELADLEEFYCHGNEITGTIPTYVGRLDKLEVLVLSENNLIGTLPDELNELTNLRSLFIDSFTKHSVGLSGPMLDFRNARNLTEIYLNSNGLTGTVPADLLSGIGNKAQTITVGLRSNELTGTVPLELKRFSRLNIDLAGNQISAIDPELCKLDGWMSGLVGKFQCDAILCPPGTFNQHGRRFNTDTECAPCEGEEAEQSPYFGSLTCMSEEKKKEREILELFYNTCGGANWKNSDNWMNDDVDVCHWYGIACHEGRLVDSILLGSNNVVGTPPRELFTMTGLKWLWLYSNPIDFKFDGIGDAPKLTSLLLDSTGLTSLDGVEDASVLEDLDVRFNNLQGPLPAGLSKLVNLKTFSCADNDLDGGLPSFVALKKLERLRMGGNGFTGPLQDYSTNSKLKSVDLSGNNLGGPIPSSFLKNTDREEEVFVDLSSNLLTGMVPASLDSFRKLTLYLRDNRITGIDPTLCDNDMWNDGDVGSFQCDGILCPQGAYAPDTGRASKQGSQCVPCGQSQYFGASTCGGAASTKSDASVFGTGWALGLVSMAATAMACWIGFGM